MGNGALYMEDEEKKKKTIEDLNNKEFMEDLEYWVDYAQVQSPPFVDATFNIIRKYVKDLYRRMLK